MTRQIVRQIGTRCFIGSVLIRGQGGHAREEEVGNAAVCAVKGLLLRDTESDIAARAPYCSCLNGPER